MSLKDEQERFIIAKKKRSILGQYIIVNKHCYYNFRIDALCYGAVSLEQIRFFKSKEDAMDFIDKKWLKYPDKVKGWKVYKASALLKEIGE